MAIGTTPTASLDEQLRARVPAVPATRALIGLNLVVFSAMLAAGAGFWSSPNGVQLAWGANFGPATQDGEWWRLGSALFLHFGAVHLAMNLWALWDGGQLVERLLGHGRFVVLYIVSGLGGNLMSLVVQGQRAVSGGASGAIFGIYGALLVCLWAERAALDQREFRWFFWGAAGFAAGTLTLGYFVPGIDQAAHVGGFVTGGVAGFALRPFAEQRKARALAAGGLLLAAVLLWFELPPPSYRWGEEKAARETIGEFLREDAEIRDTWRDIRRGGEAGASFEQLAGRIEREVAERYEDSFEHLSQLHLDPAAPSATRLEAARRDAEAKRDAAFGLAQELRREARAVDSAARR